MTWQQECEYIVLHKHTAKNNHGLLSYNYYIFSDVPALNYILGMHEHNLLRKCLFYMENSMRMHPALQKMSVKIPALIVACGILAVSATGIFSYFSAKSAVEQEAKAKLATVLADRTAALDEWLKGIKGDLVTQAQNPTVNNALLAFIDGWKQLGTNQRQTLQRLYITDNPNPTGKKEELESASDGSAYSAAHARYHPYLRTFLRDRDYYDIFLFDTNGNLVYTVFKELDYATNVMNGQWAKTDLGNAFRAARDNPKAGSVAFFDFRPYAPSNDAPASFISTPLLDAGGKLQGVLVFQMPIGRLNGLMQAKSGLGETGEA